MFENITIYNFITAPWFIIALLLELILKGIALWKCGRNNQLGWFIAILIINSIGLLPLIYLITFQKKQHEIL
ncbi:MAG TPA: DUF5652 family protein [Cytophagaceae bacterium]|jgi:hypothetical protein|nr:DUF5652 family protein [Cytophagaceae bacterium]